MLVWEDDLRSTTIPAVGDMPNHLRDAKVVLTLVGGRVVFDREGALK